MPVPSGCEPEGLFGFNRMRRGCKADRYAVSYGLTVSIATPSPRCNGGCALEILGDFDQFWSLYPLKVSKGDARKAFGQALKKTTSYAIRQALEVQLAAGVFAAKVADAQRRGLPDKQLIAYPASWLRAERWDDEIVVVTTRPAFRNGALEALAGMAESNLLLEYRGDD